MSQPGMVGRVLGDRYRLDSLLGQGGMSSVYKATDPNLRRTVAIKLIHPHLTTDPEFLRRFESEAASVAQLRHPNIIQVYDFERDGDTYYMVLEYVPGESLDRRLRRLSAEGRRVGLDEAAAIIADIAEAVDYAHGQGLIHRDIKPANIMLTERGQAVLMDFGVAKIIGGTEHTATGMLVGTAYYISPEQVRGEPPSARSDIYALGVTLFEMLAGRPPYTGDSAMSIMLKHVSEPIPDLQRIAPETSPHLVAVVEKAMAKDPRERYASARDMAVALRQTGTMPAGGPATMREQIPGRSAVMATLVEPETVPGPAGRPSPPSNPAARPAPSAVRPAPTAGLAQRTTPPLAPPSMAPQVPAASGVGPVPAKPASRGCLWVLAGAGVVLLCLFLFYAASALFGVAMFLRTTPTPPLPSSTAMAAAVYQDDFSNASSGWTINSNSIGAAKYANGALVIQVAVKDGLFVSTSASGELSNVHVEVTAAGTGQQADEGFGVICDYSDDNHFYYLGISRGGFYAIVKRENGKPVILTDPNNNWVRSVRIAQGAPSYRVGADCGADGTLTLYADGKQVATVKDSSYKSGVLGLFVASSVQGPAEIHFTNLVASALP